MSGISGQGFPAWSSKCPRGPENSSIALRIRRIRLKLSANPQPQRIHHAIHFSQRITSPHLIQNECEFLVRESPLPNAPQSDASTKRTFDSRNRERIPGTTTLPIGIDEYRWMIEGEGESWLAMAMASSDPIHRLVPQLRKSLSAEQTSLLVDQVQLRARAERKFTTARSMYFTSPLLEQATDERVAQLKAIRFARDTAIADICCGIGGDLMAIAQRGPTVGVDRNEIACYLASSNVAKHVRDCQVIEQDALTVRLNDIESVHIDPDRRVGGRRSIRLENHEPARDELLELRRRCTNLAIKLAPATDTHDDFFQNAELEWIGSRRDCRQLMSWFGNLAREPNRRTATIMGPAGDHRWVGDIEEADITETVGAFLIEPHAPLLAADLAGHLANREGLRRLIPGGGYLTADVTNDSPFYDAYRVQMSMAYRPKRIRAELSTLNIGQLTVKTRGVAMPPDQIRRECSPKKGSESAVLFVYRWGAKIMAVLAEPKSIAIE